MKASKGFTLIELLIYARLTAMVMGLFGAILITILRVQGEQSSSSKVSSELSFMMTTIKRHIHEAVTVPNVDVTGEHIVIMKNNGPVSINYSPIEKAILIADSTLPDAGGKLNSRLTKIDALNFEELQDADNPSSTVIRITITASASTTDPTRQNTRTLEATASPFLQSQ